VEAPFQPNNGRYGLVTHIDERSYWCSIRQTGREATRVELGVAQANASFTTDSATAFMTVIGSGSCHSFKVRAQPMRLALLGDPA
jgi:hypothetical protein